MHVCRSLLRTFSRLSHGLAALSAVAVLLFSSLPARAQVCLPTPPGLVSWWRAEGNGNDFAGANNGVLVNGVGFAAGEVGQSFAFNGASQYVQIANSPGLDPTGSFTIEAWIYPQPSAGAQIILSKWGDTGDYSNERCYIFAIVPGNALIFAISDLANQWNGAFQGLQTANNVIPFNIWSHVVAVYDQTSGTRRIYLNGTVVAQRTDPPITILNAGNPVGIGAGPYASDSIRDFFTGKIDEVSFYNVALNSAQVQGLYLAGTAGKCALPAPPQIISQPQDQSVLPGQSASFSVAVTGSGPVAYQWLFDGNSVAGATGSSYTVSNAVPLNNGIYSVLVTNAYGMVLSGNATLTVTGLPPVITLQPQGRGLLLGANTTFNISAGGSAPLSYQWLFNGAVINGASSAILVLTNLPLSASGDYSALVTNYFGAVTSQVATLTVTQAVCTPVLNGLTSWWAGEGSAVDLVGGNNGLLINGVGFAPGKVGQAFKFNGTNQYVSIPSQPSLNPTGSFSIEAWVLPQGGSGAQMIFGKWGDTGDYGNERCYVLVLVPGNILQFGISDAANQGNGSLHVFNSPNNAVTNGVWSHVAAVYNQTTGTRQIYVNGALVAQRADPPITVLNAPNPIGIGAGPYASFSIRDYFKGQIDEVSFYHRALTAAEVGAIFNADSAGKCPPQFPPEITSQPLSQTAPAWTNVNFSVSASGTAPLAYQWQFGTNVLPNATNSVLSLTNVTAADAGVYSVTVTNPYGAAASSNAVLTVLPPPSLVQVASVTATSAVVTVPVTLLSRGTENGLGFSLNFNPADLTFAGINAGSGVVANASLLFNTNAAAFGRLGVLLALPGAGTFPAGTQEVADVSFFVNSGTNPLMATISFGDTPTARQISDPLANSLPATFLAGAVTIPWLGYEGDVAPLPGGDGAVTLIDWVQVGRFVAGLDTITNASEFQRADCAPRATFGDGQLTVADWVQAGRYAAGLDPLTVAGGPAVDVNGSGAFKQPVGLDFGPVDSGRILKVVNAAALPAQACQVSVQLTALGNENAVGFSLQIDPTQVRLLGVTLGGGDPDATLIVNTNLTPANGLVAIVLSLPFGTVFSPGTYEVVRLNFMLLPTAATSANLLFANRPAISAVSDARGNALSTTYQNGVLSVGTLNAPTLRATASPAGLVLTWPVNAFGYTVQTSTNLGSGAWTTVSAVPIASGADQSVTLPVPPGAQHYYRLYHP